MFGFRLSLLGSQTECKGEHNRRLFHKAPQAGTKIPSGHLSVISDWIEAAKGAETVVVHLE